MAQPELLNNSTIKNSLILAAFALVTTGLVVLTSAITRAPIAEAQQQALKAALYEVLPANDLHDNDMIKQAINLPKDKRLGNKTAKLAYIARHQGEPQAAILQVTAPEGYGGSIHLLVGITATGNISGVRVVPPHFETPGLGDAIEVSKSDWMLNFTGKSLQNPPSDQWKVKKDGGQFDALTGATITPRAVVDAVHKALLYFQEHKTALFNAQPDAMHSTRDDSHGG